MPVSSYKLMNLYESYSFEFSKSEEECCKVYKFSGWGTKTDEISALGTL